MTNILRHADGGRVHVQTQVEGAMLQLVIADHGKGGASFKHRNGLTNCTRRAELMGGTFAADPGNPGFQLRLCVPIGE